MVDMALLEALHTDISVAPPTEYADSSTPNLLPEGTYDFVLKGFEVISDREDPSLFKGFNITVVVDGGAYDGRVVNRLSIWASPFYRNGVKVSGLGDFIRAIDASAEWSSAADAAKILQMAVDRRMPFRLKLGWEAFDQGKYDAAGGRALENKSPEQKKLRKDCTIKGMRNFPQNPDGTYRPEIEDSEGNLMEARLAINGYVSSHKRR
jgi:hypothetical protein